jgi:hypothetical protein
VTIFSGHGSAVVKTYPAPLAGFPSLESPHHVFAGPGERRMARRTAIGASSRTIASGSAALCNATSCIWARSARRSPRPGANPLKRSTRTPDIRGPWRCSLRIAPRWPRPITRSCSLARRRCSCADRGNGARCGWLGSCGVSCNSIGSGPIVSGRTQGHPMGPGRAGAGVVSTDRPRQRVETAP